VIGFGIVFLVFDLLTKNNLGEAAIYCTKIFIFFVLKDRRPLAVSGAEPDRGPGFQWKAGPGRADAAPVPEIPDFRFSPPIYTDFRWFPDVVEFFRKTHHVWG